MYYNILLIFGVCLCVFAFIAAADYRLTQAHKSEMAHRDNASNNTIIKLKAQVDSVNKEIAIYDDVVFGVLTYNIEYLPCKELIRGNLDMLRTMKRDNVLPLWKDIGRDIYSDSIYLSRN